MTNLKELSKRWDLILAEYQLAIQQFRLACMKNASGAELDDIRVKLHTLLDVSLDLEIDFAKENSKDVG